MSGNPLDVPENCVQLKNEKTKIQKSNGAFNDCHSASEIKLLKKLLLHLTKPSYVLGLGTESIRVKNRSKLLRLVRKLMRISDWKVVSGLMSVLLRGTLKKDSPENSRMKYLVTMELLKHIDRDCFNTKKIKKVYDIWMRQIGQMSNFRLEVQVEYNLFCLTQGNLEEAKQTAMELMQLSGFQNDRISNLVVGLTYYCLWHSNIPKEMRWGDMEASSSHVIFEGSGTRLSSVVENSEEHYSVNNHNPDTHSHYDSETSVMNNKTEGPNIIPDREVSGLLPVKQETENRGQSFQAQGFYMNSDENFRDEAADSGSYGAASDYTSIFGSHGASLHHISIFDSHGLHPWLLPLKLPNPEDDEEISEYLRRQIENDSYYYDALKYLWSALKPDPDLIFNPLVSAALVPFVQLLLLGYKVKMAMNVVLECCTNSSLVLPFRIRACLLEHFDHQNFPELTSCYENILKRDPTCNKSLSKLLNMHHKGDYCSASLLEMIALHLDATDAEDATWKEFAICFLNLTKSDEDVLSGCHGAKKRGRQSMYSTSYKKIPKVFTEPKSAKSWWFRCKWWLRRYFSSEILQKELQSGSFLLLACKAACASHMYGSEMDYVVQASICLQEENKELFLFLKMHRENSIGFYSCVMQTPVLRKRKRANHDSLS